MSTKLPFETSLLPLTSHSDERGSFTEIFRASWLHQPPPPQWNVVNSNANVLRGVHVHLRHWDFLLAIQGSLLIGLRDLRRDSPTFGLVSMIELNCPESGALCIPPGVAHGFYFSTPSIHVYGVSEYWDIHDELGCRFDDPELEIPWPCSAPMLSPRDAVLPPLAELISEVNGTRHNAELGSTPELLRPNFASDV